jgi:3-deoxy-7-phosphoheptulonate synthase
VATEGNKDCHVILRGGQTPNYDAESVQTACAALQKAGLRPAVMIDCSHANSSKTAERQHEVAQAIAQQLAGGSHAIFGVMVESHIRDGAQKFTPGKDDPKKLEYGKSITDACLGWDETVQMLQTLSDAVNTRRKKK